MNVTEMVAHLQRVAAELDLPFGDRTMTYNSRSAQELGKWAEEQGRGERFHRAVFRAYFADGRNIAEPDVLAEIVRSVGLSARSAAEIIENRSFRQAVDDDWNLSRRAGITAVPTFRMDKELLVGAQPAAVLEKFLVSHGVSPRSGRQPS